MQIARHQYRTERLFAGLFHRLAALPGAAFDRLVAIGEASGDARRLDTIRQLSDADLAAMGLTRADAVRHALRHRFL